MTASSGVGTSQAAPEERVVRWRRGLTQLGVTADPGLVRDLGLLMTTPRERASVSATAGGRATEYGAALGRLMDHPTVHELQRLHLDDDAVVVVLARVLRPLRPTSMVGAGEAAAMGPSELVRHFAAIDIALELLEVDMLRLLQTARGTAVAGEGALTPLVQVDLLAALDSPMAAEIVRFSLELLPSLANDVRKAAPGSLPRDGHQGLTRHGSVDSLVPSELAWPDDELVRRLLDDEVLFYARDRREDPAKRVHLLVVDASASMRGDRTTFARGVAITLARHLELAGEESRIHFFDGQLYEPLPVRPGRGRGTTAMMIPYVLAFRGERGRSPERVLRQLIVELDVLRGRDRRAPVVHLITHGAFYAPRPLVAQLQARSTVHAALMMPARAGGSNPTTRPARPSLDWLDLVHDWVVIEAASLRQSHERTERAREVVQRLGRAAGDP